MAFWQIELIHKSDFFFFLSFFSLSSSGLTPFFTIGQRIGVRNCHATGGHRKTNIFTSIVSGLGGRAHLRPVMLIRLRPRQNESPEEKKKKNSNNSKELDAIEAWRLEVN
jgi:hypothetical protein